MIDERTIYAEMILPANHPAYCEMYLWIQPKRAEAIPLILNPSQIRLDKTILKCIQDGRPVRILILKARQQGFSTGTESFIYKKTTTQSDFRSLIIAHDGEAAKNLYEMFRVYYEMFPQNLRPHRKSQGNVKGLNFDLLRSKIRVLSAENPLASSGSTYQAAHISELGKWRDAETAMTSLMQAIPDDGMVIVESTAHGIGNYFYDMWIRARKGNYLDDDFIPLFFPWHEHPEYQKKLRKDEVIEPDTEELYYYERFNLTLEQLKWLRWAKKTKCHDSWQVFKQEYPAYEEEAFLSTGTPVFDMKALQARELNLRKTPPSFHQGDIILTEKASELDDDKGDVKVSAEFVPDKYGNVIIYGDLPNPRDNMAHRYCFGVDVCEGIDAEEGHGRISKTDYNCIIGWDKVTGEEKVFVRNKHDPDILGRELVALVVYFGGNLPESAWPFSLIERNSPGITTVVVQRDLMKRYGIPLGRMFHRGVEDKHAMDRSHLLGFRTSTDTKALIIGETVSRIRDGLDGIKTLEIVNECKTFVRSGPKRMGAQRGKHDDTVMGMALAYKAIVSDKLPYKIKIVYPLTGWRKKLADEAGRNRSQVNIWEGCIG